MTAVATLVAATILVGGQAAGADDPREVRGRSLFAKGQYQEALDIFADLFAEKSDPLYLRNIGRCYQKLRRPDKAIDSFQEYLRRSPRLKEPEREEIKGFIREMEELQASEAGARHEGTRADRPPAPGEASATSEPANATAPANMMIAPAVARSEPDGANLAKAAPSEPVAADQPSGSLTHRWWFWTAIGAAVAGAGITTFLLVQGPHKPGCPGGYDCP